MSDLSDRIAEHVALATVTDVIVADFANAMIALAASEKAVRDAFVAASPGSATFSRAGQIAISAYLVTLAERLASGETRPDYLKPVGTLAAEAWAGVAS